MTGAGRRRRAGTAYLFFGEAVPAPLFRETYESYLQLLERAGAMQAGAPKAGLAQSYGARSNAGTIILNK